MAAVLACGDGALLSHRSAAVLWGLREGGGARVDVTTARRVGRGRAPIRVHWRPSVAAADACSCRRRSVHLGGTHAARPRGGRLRRASSRRPAIAPSSCASSTDARSMTLLARVAGERGHAPSPRDARTARPAERPDPHRDRAPDARALQSPLPSPAGRERLDPTERHRIRARLPLAAARKLIVETDGAQTHRTRKAFEADRRRDQLLAEAGYTTLRFTWRQVTTEPERVARTIAAVLKRAVTHTSLRGNSALDRRSPQADDLRMSQSKTNNIAARAGRWSAQHRKKAIVGWLLFVILAVFIGGSVGTKTLDDVDDNGIGESGRADTAVSQNFPDKVSESVMVQNKNASVRDPEFKAVVADVEAALEERPRRQEHQQPVRRGQRGPALEGRPLGAHHVRAARQGRTGGGPGRGTARDRRQAGQAARRLHDRGVRRRERRPGAVEGVLG